MTSLRAQLQKIGHPPNKPFRYSDFFLRPNRLSAAMRSMESPGEFHAVSTKADREIDESWTQECQGIAWVGTHWILSSNGSEWAGGVQRKALYTFNASTGFHDDDVVHRFVINDRTVPLPGGIYHVGAITWQGGMLHVDHWNDQGAHVLRFTVTNGVPSYQDYVPLRHDSGRRVGLVGICPWDGSFITADTARNFGPTVTPSIIAAKIGSWVPVAVENQRINGDRLYIHDADGKDKGEIPLDPPITDGGYVQGGFVSPNRHIYIASGISGNAPYQYIYGYHALTGKRFATIGVVAKGLSQELEGCSLVDLGMDGQPVQIVAVLLENNAHLSKDDTYIKAFAAERPEFI